MKLRVVVWLCLALSSAQAVILYRTGDPNENKTEPIGPGYDNSGWQYEAQWGGFLGTPIAPHFFLSAAHIGNAGNDLFTFQNVTYHVLGSNYDPQSDLVLWEVREEFPLFAPMYSRIDEVGQRIIAIGRGTQRGVPVLVDSELKGWRWGGSDSVMRWGENVISAVVSNGPNFDLLSANFDAVGLPNECHFSSGDSGGAVFMQDGPTWKLAGINYAVDGPFYPGMADAGAFDAALFETSGLYQKDDANFVAVSGPSALYPTRVSTKLPWICAKIARPVSGREDNDLTITYTRVTLPATDVIYTVQQSIDLISWQPASATDVIVSTNGSTQLVKSKVAMGANPVLFLRVQIRRAP